MTIYCKIAKWITDLLINIGAFYWHDYCHHCPKLLVFNGVITEEGMAHFGGNVIKEISQQLNCSAQRWWFLTTAGQDNFPLKKIICYFHKSPLATRDARPAPPRPRGKWLPRAAPAPKIFNSAPPCPAHPGKRGRCPAPPRKLPRGKNRGKRSYIIKSFWESKTFDQYF